MRGFAYERDGWVYFHVASDPSFGALAEAGGYHGYGEWLATANERGNTPNDPRKQDPLDFVLWQAQQDGEPAWESPWGLGRPGWHIECSAMAMRYLGDRIDTHGGGADLIFPHHTCEIAQSENATGERPFVQIWMHCGMVYLGEEKMSKSLGNLVLVRDLLQRYSADAVRVLLLSHHYRDPWEYTEEDMRRSAARAACYAEAAARPLPGSAINDDESGDDNAQEARQRFDAALNNDLDTPTALVALSDLEKDDTIPAGAKFETFAWVDRVFALDVVRDVGRDPRPSGDLPPGATELLEQRSQAREAKDWAESDRLRTELAGLGVVVTDGPDGQSWTLG